MPQSSVSGALGSSSLSASTAGGGLAGSAKPVRRARPLRRLLSALSPPSAPVLVAMCAWLMRAWCWSRCPVRLPGVLADRLAVHRSRRHQQRHARLRQCSTAWCVCPAADRSCTCSRALRDCSTLGTPTLRLTTFPLLPARARASRETALRLDPPPPTRARASPLAAADCALPYGRKGPHPERHPKPHVHRAGQPRRERERPPLVWPQAAAAFAPLPLFSAFGCADLWMV